MVDVRALPTTDGDVIDLTAIDPYKTWIMAGDPGSLIKHPLVLSNDPFQRARMIYENDIEEWPRVIAVDFFIPTSGHSNWSPNGNLFIDHSLKTQQLDFLMSFFENWDDLNGSLIISFCDESPEINAVLETVYSLMAIYEIPHDKIQFMGHNFAGQDVINDFAKENGEKPINYIVKWWMIGHCDTDYIESIVSRAYTGRECTYTSTAPDMTPKNNTFIFLNRRETDNRLALLYLLWQKGVKHVDSIISAFPPLRLYGLSAGRADASASETGERNHYTTTFFRSMLKNLVPATATELTDVDTHNFKHEMKLGKSLPGDHAFIGDVESKFVPLDNDAYIWLTCESTSDLKEKNIFFTEKVLKPMMYGQALMVFAQPGFIKAFKALGFHTLCEEYGISEEYDNVVDDAQRIDMIAEEIIKVGSVPLLKMHDIYQTLEDKVQENRNRMWCMLSNIPDKKSFHLHQTEFLLDQISSPSFKNTEEALKTYKDFWDFSIIGNK